MAQIWPIQIFTDCQEDSNYQTPFKTCAQNSSCEGCPVRIRFEKELQKDAAS